MKKRKLLVYIAFTVFWIVMYYAKAHSLSADDILQKIDDNMVFDSRSATALMRIHTPEGVQEKKLVLVNRGLNKARAEFLQPPRDQGVKYLKLEKNLWMFMPSVARTIKISGHMLRQSMMGSDMSYEDSMENPRLADDYIPKLLPSEKLGGQQVYVLSLSAKRPDLSYPAQKLWVDPETYLPVKVEKYAVTGKLLKSETLGNAQKFGSRHFPLYYKMVDVLRGTGGTEFILSDVKFQVEISDAAFSLRALERR